MIVVVGQKHQYSSVEAAARLVFSTRKSEHVTPLFRELHWLKVPDRIKFRLCVLAYRCLHGSTPPYFAETLLSPLTLNYVAVAGPYRHTRAIIATSHSVTVPFRRPLRRPGMHLSEHRRRTWRVVSSLKHVYSRHRLKTGHDRATYSYLDCFVCCRALTTDL